MVAKQEQKTQEILKETENLKATKDAEREKNVEEIQLQKELLQKQKEKVRILEDKVDPYDFNPRFFEGQNLVCNMLSPCYIILVRK